MFLRQKDIALLGVAAIALALAFGIYANAPAILAQETGVVNNFTDAVVPDTAADEPQTVVGIFLEEAGALIAAISALVTGAGGIVVYVASALRSRTGDKIVSDKAYAQLLNIVGLVEEKSNQLRDSHRQVMEMRETIDATMTGLKAFNPEASEKINSALTVANQTMQNQIQPQVAAWQTEQDRFFETLKKNVESLKSS